MTTTWSMTGSRSSKAVCTSGSESAPSNPAKASGTATFSSIVAGNTVTVGGLTFTCVAIGGAGQSFDVGASDTAAAANLAAAINLYSLQLGVTATSADAVVTITAVEYGTGPNSIPLTKVGDPITVSAATLANGVNAVGSPLTGVGGYQVIVKAVTSNATVAAGSLAAYVLNEVDGVWGRAPGLDLTVPAGALRSFAYPAVAVTVPRGRVAYLPTGVTISAGNAEVYILCSQPQGIPGYGGAL